MGCWHALPSNLDHETGVVEPVVVVLQTTSLPFADSWKTWCG